MGLNKVNDILVGDIKTELEQTQERSLHGVDVMDRVEAVGDVGEHAIEAHAVFFDKLEEERIEKKRQALVLIAEMQDEHRMRTDISACMAHISHTRSVVHFVQCSPTPHAHLMHTRLVRGMPFPTWHALHFR